ncbi:MAG: ectonucleotide pyrophosphatase/phosphodiesterase [Luteimonas sp.]
MTLPRLTAFVLIVCTASLSACASTQKANGDADDASHDSVVLISIDALRADYLDLGITPNLSRIAHDGVRAAWMTPSYPSLTFPNHYTLVTGLRPDHHGIVHNTMQDAALGGFKSTDHAAVGDARWWGGEPIWVGVEKAGFRAATMFWPGSEAPIQGHYPTYWKPFDVEFPLDARVDQVLRWLDAPETARPRLVTLYIETLDKAAHAHGPDSPQALRALRACDAAVGRLLRGLSAQHRLDRINLIVVSDHGMATVLPGHAIAVEDIVSLDEAAVVTIGQSIGIAPRAGHETAVTQRLLGAHAQYDCWRKGDLPARWHYGTHPRVPPIVCQMHEGWDALPRATLVERSAGETRGSHGYDPTLPSMRAIFLARGPAFRRGARIPAFDNVNVYPLLAHLLDIVPAQNDGDAQTLLPALKKSR